MKQFYKQAPNKQTRSKARRRGLVVRVKIHVQEVVNSNPGPAVEAIYHAPLIWIKSMKAKFVEKVTWHCCMCCNPAKGRVEFEDGKKKKKKKKKTRSKTQSNSLKRALSIKRLNFTIY
jgi:hypothetical protein